MLRFSHDVPRDRWQPRLEALEHERAQAPTLIETGDENGSLVVQARGLLLRSLSYDERRDVFEVTVFQPSPRGEEVLGHVVDHPLRVRLDGPDGIVPATVAVDAADGTLTIVRVLAQPAFEG